VVYLVVLACVLKVVNFLEKKNVHPHAYVYRKYYLYGKQSIVRLFSWLSGLNIIHRPQCLLGWCAENSRMAWV